MSDTTRTTTVRRVLQPGTYRYTLFVLVCSLIVLVIAGAGGVAYMLKEQDRKVAEAKKQVEEHERQRDQEWCELLTYIARPPSPGVEMNERQRETVRLLQTLAADKGCGPG